MIQHSKPTFIGYTKIIRFLKDILKSGYLSEGKFVRQFEEELCKFFGSKYAIGVSSGTAALHLALLSLGVDKNSEVIIPAYTCSAILNAVLYTQAKPVILDVNLSDFGISYEEVKKKITKRTKAVIVPHMFGYPASDIDKIVNLGVPVIEDTTQSLGAKIDGYLTGSFGKINIISFYATKMLTTFGEGGAILTQDRKIYSYIIDIKEYDKKMDFKLRYNYKITEIQSMMGLLQLKMLPQWITARKKIFQHYKNGLKNCNNIKIFPPLIKSDPVFYRFIIQVLKKIDLEYYIRKFKSLGIEIARPIYLPLDKYYTGNFFCKNSKILYDTTLSLPIYPSLKMSELNYIVETTKKLFG
ncbi:MAG: DegT/DnrJ/EryC1/StrS aminotransferase family protein [Endomicrobia bacterium]|nr:DegT/DnrJ/EryC1/StrS aminotransferase family protein [Endomicrobiia bacterium]